MLCIKPWCVFILIVRCRWTQNQSFRQLRSGSNNFKHLDVRLNGYIAIFMPQKPGYEATIEHANPTKWIALRSFSFHKAWFLKLPYPRTNVLDRYDVITTSNWYRMFQNHNPILMVLQERLQTYTVWLKVISHFEACFSNPSLVKRSNGYLLWYFFILGVISPKFSLISRSTIPKTLHSENKTSTCKGNILLVLSLPSFINDIIRRNTFSIA